MRYLLRKIWKFVKGKFDIPNTPRALPMRFHKDEDLDLYTWEDWHKEAKEKYPIRHFLFHDLPIWVSVRYRIYIEDPIYWVESYLIRKDHLLNLSGAPSDDYKGTYKWGYTGPQHVLEHAVYKSFMLYVKELDSLQEYRDEANGIKKEKYYLGHGIDERLKFLQEEHDNADDNDKGQFVIWLVTCMRTKELFTFFNEELPALYQQSLDMLGKADGMSRDERLELYEERSMFDEFIESKLEEKMIEVIKMRKSMWT